MQKQKDEEASMWDGIERCSDCGEKLNKMERIAGREQCYECFEDSQHCD